MSVVEEDMYHTSIMHGHSGTRKFIHICSTYVWYSNINRTKVVTTLGLETTCIILSMNNLQWLTGTLFFFSQFFVNIKTVFVNMRAMYFSRHN